MNVCVFPLSVLCVSIMVYSFLDGYQQDCSIQSTIDVSYNNMRLLNACN